MPKAKTPTPSIEELETLIADERSAVEILPDGDVRITEAEKKAPKILTRRQRLGSNY